MVDEPCPVCGATPSPIYEVRDLLLEQEGRWDVAECRCGHLTLQPLPDEDALRAFYAELWTPRAREIMTSIGKSGFERRLQRTRVRLIAAARSQAPEQVLDVGCGLGFYLRLLRERFRTPCMPIPYISGKWCWIE